MKKNECISWEWKVPRLQKVFRVMKLTVFLLLLSVISVFASKSYSQTTVLNLDMENSTVKEVLRNIEKQSEFVFMYSEKLIDVNHEVSVTVKNKKIYEVLDELFAKTNVKYTVKDRFILLTTVDVAGNEITVQQQRTVSGTVTDDSGQPLPGVTVVVKGTTQGTMTNVDGEYSISNIPENTTLQFSFVGMRTQEIEVGSQTSINIEMVTDAIGIEEVVAIGYGTMRKSDLTGAVASVKGGDLATIPTSNLMQSLAGRTPGVYVLQQSGAPGSGWNVQIRGRNSILGGNEPLYVVDGFPLSGSGNITMLNNSEVESVEILKDASATAIYGSRGANGVVIITTKQGKKGITTVDFESSYGVQTLRKKLDLMDATEYANFMNEQAVNDGLSPHFTQTEINGFGKGFDWQDFVFKSAPILNNTLTVNGGTEKTRFSVSGGVFDQQGIVKGTGFRRYSLRANLNHEINKIFSIQYSSILTKSQTEDEPQGGARGSNVVNAAMQAPPTLKPFNQDGTYTIISAGHPFLSATIINPINYINEDERLTDKNSVLANLALLVQPIDGLVLKISGGIENIESRFDHYRTTNFLYSSGSANISLSRIRSLLNENTISYNKIINGIHNIDAVAGFTYQDYQSTPLGVSGVGFLSNIFETYDIGAAATPGIPSSSYSKWTLLSSIARVNYTFNNRYLFTASLRADGSSKFSVGNKWAYFPSASFAWKIKEESFMKDNKFIDDFKLRTSWGVTGSQAISPYETLTQLSSDKTVYGDNLYTTFGPKNTLSSSLKWETTEQANFGVDLAWLKYRYQLTADFYIKNTHDLLNAVILPPSIGYATTVKNVGKIRNTGLELRLDSKILRGKINWDLSVNFAINRSEVIKLYEGQNIHTGEFNYNVLADNAKILREGEPFGVFYGYLRDGYDEQGNEKYKDLHDDGSINELDKTIIGDPNPGFTYGLNSALSYKDFELTLFFQGSYGNDILNVSGLSSLDYPGGLNLPKDVYGNNWTPNNTDAKYPINSRFVNIKLSDRQIEDGSYLRLKNIQLLYSIPKKWNVNVLKDAQIYVSGQNLLTLTNYSWLDPEAVNVFGQGIDQHIYPTSKTYSLGIKVTF